MDGPSALHRRSLLHVVAESLEEAREKRAEGYWASEQTVDFQSTGEATELVEVEHSGGE